MDVRSHGPAELAEAVGMVAQEPETQVVSTTVRAEIELPLELRGVAPAARSRAVEEVSLALAIDHLLERTTDTLSGGSSSASRWRPPSPPGPGWCCWTSRPPSSIQWPGTS